MGFGPVQAATHRPPCERVSAYEKVSACRPERELRLARDAECGLDNGYEYLRVPQQVVCLSGRRRPGKPGFGRGALVRSCREERGPLRECGLDLRQQFPHTAWAPAAGPAGRLSANRDHSRSRTQRGQMGGHIAPRRRGLIHGVSQPASRGFK
jgi:hypothetical protein